MDKINTFKCHLKLLLLTKMTGIQVIFEEYAVELRRNHIKKKYYIKCTYHRLKVTAKSDTMNIPFKITIDFNY